MTFELEGFVTLERDMSVFEGSVFNTALFVGLLHIDPLHVRGVVRDTAGKPLKAAAILVIEALRPDMATHDLTDKRGRFDVVLSQAARLMVIASMPCYEPSVVMVPEPRAGERKTPEVTLTLQRVAEWRARLSDCK